MIDLTGRSCCTIEFGKRKPKSLFGITTAKLLKYTYHILALICVPCYCPGLVAVLLYHDGRRCLLSALRTLLQSREGLTWTLELDEEMSGLIMSFTKQMIEEGKSLVFKTYS